MGSLNPFSVNAGGSPVAGYFLLRRHKKVTQEKATPVCRATLSECGQRAYP